MYASLAVISALQLVFVLRTDEVVWAVGIVEQAKSIIERGFYGIGSIPQTMRPPGFPVMLASLCSTVGCTHTVFIRSIIVLTTLGFIASYILLRGLEGRLVAAVSCLLLATSPIFFAIATRNIWSDLPYFFASTVTLVLAIRLETTKSSFARLGLSLFCSFFLIASVLIRSVGIGLLMGFVAWLSVSFWTDRQAALRRLRNFVPILILGVAVQAAWMQWSAKHQVLEWPELEGYPKSYLAQLKVKDGNYPELGTALLPDIPSRVARNLNEHAVTLTKLITRKEFINDAWYSPWVLWTILLAFIGLSHTIWNTGGDLTDWYFASYELIYLLWPWFGDIRFFLPIAPLACLYVWRGAKVFLHLVVEKPSSIAVIVVCPLSFIVAMFACVAAWRSGNLQPTLAAVLWIALGVGCTALAWNELRHPKLLGAVLSHLRVVAVTERFRRAVKIVGLMSIAVLIGVGVLQDVKEARTNVFFDSTQKAPNPDMAAGNWIADNTPKTAVIMARQPGIIYHFSTRRSVWFPPSSDPQILIKGIRRHNIEFIVIVERLNNYWLPPESVCFESLRRVFPKAFQLVHEEPLFKIFKFVPDFEPVHS